MANRLVSKKGLWIGGLAVAALLVATAIPGLATPAQRTIALAITSPTTAAANTPGVVFHAKVTNNSPNGSVSNPSSFRVTVPLGFTVTGAALATQASGESTNANPSAAIITTAGTSSVKGTVTVNSIKPLQRLEFVTVLITATTPNVSGTCNGSGTASGSWSAAASTGSTYGQGGGQEFTVTTNPLPTTLLTKSCTTPTITIVATTPTTYTAVGGTMTFSATATGDPSPTVTWQSSTDQVTWTAVCSTGPTCSFSTVDTDDGNYYRATANNGVPTATSNVYSNAIQIAYAPPCGTPVTETGGGTTAKVILVKNPVNTDNNPATTCDPKPFVLVVGEKSIQVLPTGSTCSLVLNTCATYVVYSDAWAPETAVPAVPATIVSPTGNPPSTTGTEPEVWCDGTYDETDAPSPTNLDGTYGTSMPDGHTWCKILQTTAPAGTGLMQVSEISLLIGDASRNR